MRSIFYTLLSLATLATTLAIETKSPKAKDDDDWEEKTPDTVFNGQPVPPMIELTQHNLDKEISKGNW
jgi:protein disulfide-isomerase